ncbi:MAG: phosphatidate cytidylyltransferase [Halanaerobiaceae bacterium]|nr:phosphatidate cytidylyltransferase [Halanaerobiaceae bacterium]
MMLWKRVLSAVIGILFVVLFIYSGTFPFALFAVLVAFLLVKEYNAMIPVEYKYNQYLLSVYSIIIILYTYLNSKEIINISNQAFYTFVIISFFIYHIITADPKNFMEQLSYNLLGLIYICGGLAFLILLRNFSAEPFDKTNAIWLVLLTTWATDTGAFFIGNRFGKTKFTEISPKKSLEGVFGGIVSAILIVSIFSLIKGFFSLGMIIYAVFAALFAVLGDLFESCLKRSAGIKDSGNLIPGHGGVLDRLDSLFFTAPFTYLFLISFI